MSPPRIVMIMSGLLLLLTSQIKAADTPSAAPKPEEKFLSVEGRLILQPDQNESKLLLYAKDSVIYNISGEYKDLLKSILSDLGEKNWVSVNGENKGTDTVICHKKTTLDKEGKATVKTECLRQYILYVTKINSAAISKEETPKPAPEKNTQDNTFFIPPAPTIFYIKGKITAINLRSPIKTVEITFFDKDKNKIKTNLMIGADTKIARLQGKEPMYVSLQALEQNQKVSAEYTLDANGKTVALGITILEE